MADETSGRISQEAFLRRMRGHFEEAMERVAEAVEAAPDGRVIRDSEHRVRDVMDELRRRTYETAVQMRADSVESASPPSGRGDHRSGDG